MAVAIQNIGWTRIGIPNIRKRRSYAVGEMPSMTPPRRQCRANTRRISTLKVG